MSERKRRAGISTRTRFEVFKRDRFTCSYCGQTPPNVLLEVDHIVPVAAGGTDESTNLTTSCQKCNGGKSAGLLEEGAAPVVNADAIDDLRERVDQAREYTELVAEERRLRDRHIRIVFDEWAKQFGATEVTHEDGLSYWELVDGTFPNEQSVRKIVSRLSLDETLRAVEVASRKMRGSSSYSTHKYFFGICWRRIRGESGPIDEYAPKSTADDGYLELFDEIRELQAQLADREQEVEEKNAVIRSLRSSMERDGLPE